MKINLPVDWGGQDPVGTSVVLTGPDSKLFTHDQWGITT